MSTQTSRPINVIASEITKDWGKINYGAVPYLTAMMQLSNINDNYYEDSARSIIAYFLSNANSYRGEKARELKAELKAIIKC